MKDVNKFWNNRKSDSLYKASLRPLGGTLIRSFTEGEPRQGTGKWEPLQVSAWKLGTWALHPCRGFCIQSTPHPPCLGSSREKLYCAPHCRVKSHSCSEASRSAKPRPHRKSIKMSLTGEGSQGRPGSGGEPAV